MQINVTILGCGSSVGVPVIACDCEVCSCIEPKNRRTRSSLLIKSSSGKNLVIDFGADMKTQFLRENIIKLSAAILTHDHADHVNGIDDLKIFSFINKKPLEIYSDKKTIDSIANRFSYMFNSVDPNDHWGVKRVCGKEILLNSTIRICDMDISFFRQNHGLIDSLGIRINNFVYSNDVIAFPKESEKFLENIDIWLLDCLQYQNTKAHSGLEEVLKWNEIFKPKKIYLTNMSHRIDYNNIKKDLPKNIEPAYDGMNFSI